jgi:molybdate transport system ATP-binding protein
MISVDVALKLGAFNLDVALASDAGITALFGRSGAGKSVTISLIAGLARPDRGSIVLDDRVLVDTAQGIFVPAYRRRIGLVFQEARLFLRPLVRAEVLAERRLFQGGRDARDRSPPQAEAGRSFRRREAEGRDRPGAARVP